MRTTLDIDADVLAAVTALASDEGGSAGAVLSPLARQALLGNNKAEVPATRAPATVGGFRPFLSRGVLVSNEAVNALRDAEGI